MLIVSEYGRDPNACQATAHAERHWGKFAPLATDSERSTPLDAALHCATHLLPATPMRLKKAAMLSLLLAAAWFWQRQAMNPVVPPTAHTGSAHASEIIDTHTALPELLPAEAHATMACIVRAVRCPYRQDGSVFGNREGHLPARPRGYYHEYTVQTPGLNDRGARRIITGGTPPDTFYYTDDHYRSFHPFWPLQ